MRVYKNTPTSPKNTDFLCLMRFCEHQKSIHKAVMPCKYYSLRWCQTLNINFILLSFLKNKKSPLMQIRINEPNLFLSFILFHSLCVFMKTCTKKAFTKTLTIFFANPLINMMLPIYWIKHNFFLLRFFTLRNYITLGD